MYNIFMDITVNNDYIEITNPGAFVEETLRDSLSYTDKAKQYSLRRMAKNPFLKKKQAYKDLQKEVYGCLVKDIDNGIKIPSGFYHLVSHWNVDDKRTDTGSKISLPWKNKPFNLRDYQEEARNLMYDNWRGLVNFATGLGKTLTAIYAIRDFKRKTLVLCPNVSIADNFYDELVSAFGEHKVGYFGNGKKKIKDITVGIAQSVNNHVDKFISADLGLMIVDEVHHIPATTFFNISEKLSSVGRVFGLTATDFRADGKDVMITAGVGDVLICRDLVWGIQNKWLRQPYFIVRNVETTARSYRNDKNKNYKAHVLNNIDMNDRLISDIKAFLKAGKSVLCLVDEISHGELISEAVGLPFATGSGKEAKKLVKDLNSKSIPGLVGTDSKIGEGTDTKNVDVLVLANFVASKGPLWQNLGRGLRPFEGNDMLIVLDYCPVGSDMLKRHCSTRIKYYREITDKIRII